jgi:MFS family permease
MELITHPTIATSVIANFLFGGVLFGLETYVPLYIQGVSGGNAKEAGRALTPLFLAWAISVTFAARAVVRWGFRRGAMVGAGSIMLGVGFLIVGTNVPSWWWFYFTVAQAIIGTGMGPASLSFLLVVQSTVNWHQRGAATGAVIFFRTIGGAIGVGLLGGLLGRKVGSLLLHAGAGGIDVSVALRPETHVMLEPAQLALVQNSLRFALHNLYLEMLLLAAGIFLCATRLPARVAPPEVPAPLDTSEATLESELSLTTSEA